MGKNQKLLFVGTPYYNKSVTLSLLRKIKNWLSEIFKNSYSNKTVNIAMLETTKSCQAKSQDQRDAIAQRRD